MEQNEVIEIIQGAIIQVRSEGTLHTHGSSIEGEKWTDSNYILEVDYRVTGGLDWEGKWTRLTQGLCFIFWFELLDGRIQLFTVDRRKREPRV